ncbi:mitochondrial carrier [Anaeromyces robustus]|jgi:hypothetical protein|uniref:Mitochondrial carrier n=1 Tax=Anaeromyces robustus TaxID=1754192 RepID=A0A1Y1XML4_9FUNG|nr:mitochondrial carrier [Anaeromyces robustus]|eukprot:ORX86972.1 mitochondrial carrier [Anaeromyces robustus]
MPSLSNIFPNSKDKIPLYEKDELSNYEDEWQGKEYISNILKQYLISFSMSPFNVSETYLQVQYQKSKFYASVDTFPDDLKEAETEINMMSTNVWDEAKDKKAKTKKEKKEAENEVIKRKDIEVERIERLGDGVWKPIHQIIECENEGWTSLLKGSFTSWIYNVSSTISQPFLEELLNDIFDIYEDIDPRTNILSHMIVGVALSPLELVKTRLIIQSTATPVKKYRGAFHCMQTIVNEEGGMRGLYAPRYVIPAFIYHTLVPTLRIISSHILNDYLLLTPFYNPVLYPLVNTLLLAAEVVIITPLEMARKRIQCQIKKPSSRQQQLMLINSGLNEPVKFETAVEVSPIPYTGILNVIKRVILEEGNDYNDEGNGNAFTQLWYGTKSLYRGFWQILIRRFIQMAETMNDKVDDW